MSRKSLSKKVRFEIFKRDSFTCQYCGAKAPDVVLQVDHVDPVASGGNDSLLNLVTSCVGCNGGKGATPLSDDSAIEKQRRQLDLLQQRREQIDLMLEWQRGLHNVEDHATERLADYWSEVAPGWHLNDNGKKTLRKKLRQFSPDELMNAMRIATDSYLELEGEPPKATAGSVNVALDYVWRIAAVRRAERDKPYLKRLYYIRGIMRRRFYYLNEREAMREMENAIMAGVDVQTLEGLAKDCRNWTTWRECIEEEVAGALSMADVPVEDESE